MDALILAIADTDRSATGDEWREIAAYIASRGFDPSAMRTVDWRADGMQWQGHVYRRGEVCTNEM